MKLDMFEIFDDMVKEEAKKKALEAAPAAPAAAAKLDPEPPLPDPKPEPKLPDPKPEPKLPDPEPKLPGTSQE